jgi:hypothetical protein
VHPVPGALKQVQLSRNKSAGPTERKKRDMHGQYCLYNPLRAKMHVGWASV